MYSHAFPDLGHVWELLWMNPGVGLLMDGNFALRAPLGSEAIRENAAVASAPETWKQAAHRHQCAPPDRDWRPRRGHRK